MVRQSTSPGDNGAEPTARFPVIVGGLLIALSLLPVLFALVATPAGHVFSGFVEEARDGVSYVAKMSEGLAGSWLYHDPYTTEPAQETLIFLPYIWLGQLDRLLHLPPALLLHLAGTGLAIALVWSTWELCCAALQGEGARRAAFLLCLLGGGAGALTGSGGRILGYHLVSLDVGVSGSVGLQTLGLAPHILLASLGSVRLALLLLRRDGSLRGILAGMSWVLLVALAYPQMAAMWAVIALVTWSLAPSRRSAFSAGAWATAAFPYVLYGLYLKASNPVFAEWPPVHDVEIGDPLSYVLFAHLVMLPFACASAWRVLRHNRDSPLLPAVCWVLTSAVLMYLPGLPPVLHRLYYASFIPWGLLAADGLFLATAGLRGRGRERILVYTTAVMCMAGMHAVFEPLAIVALHRDDRAVYFPRDEATVLRQLADARPGGGARVMSSYLSGLWVPALSRQTAYLGFPFETLHLPQKNRDSERFYRSTDGENLRQQAQALGIDYVLWGRYERGLGGGDPGALAGWPAIGRSGEAVLYRVGGSTDSASAVRGPRATL